jgi:mono/diheme cytochrome c family protein
MRRFALLSLAVVVAILFSAPLYAQDKAAEGQKLFQQEKCGMCHMPTGKNSLEGVGSKLTADQIREWIVNPKEAASKAKQKPPMMTSFSKLSKDQVDALVAYLETKKK